MSLLNRVHGLPLNVTLLIGADVGCRNRNSTAFCVLRDGIWTVAAMVPLGGEDIRSILRGCFLQRLGLGLIDLGQYPSDRFQSGLKVSANINVVGVPLAGNTGAALPPQESTYGRYPA